VHDLANSRRKQQNQTLSFPFFFSYLVMATRTQLIRLLPLTCSLLQFSPNTAANCGREQSPSGAT